MNKELLYVDDKAIVEDEKGNKTIRINSSNLEDILKQENVIEMMENKISKLKEEIAYDEKNNLKKFNPWCSLVCLPIANAILTVPFLFKNIYAFLIYLLCVNSGGIIYCVIGDLMLYNVFKNQKKELNAKRSQLDFLEKQLKKEKDILEDLKSKEITKCESEFKTVKIKQSKRYQRIKDNSHLYYDLGFNEESYLKQFEKGNIDQKLLQKKYTDEQIGDAHAYLESKAKTLTKKRK